jgi:hypothetical protein
MRGWRTLTAGAVAAVLAAASSAAGAQGPAPTATTAATGGAPTTASPDPVDRVAAAIASEGWYADPGAVGDREALDDVASGLRPDGEQVGFALLDAEPAGSSQAFAEQVVDELAGNGEFFIRTVVVLSPDDVGVVSDTWDDEAVDAALDASIDDLRATPTDGLAAFADALGEQSTMDEDGDAFEEEDDGSSFPVVAVLAIAGIGGLALLSHFAGWSSGDGENGSSWGSSSSYRRRRSFSSGASRSRRTGSSRRSSGGGTRRRGRGSRRL